MKTKTQIQEAERIKSKENHSQIYHSQIVKTQQQKENLEISKEKKNDSSFQGILSKTFDFLSEAREAKCRGMTYSKG